MHPFQQLRHVLLVLALALGVAAPVALTTRAAADDLKPITLTVSVSGGDHVGSTFSAVIQVHGPNQEQVAGDVALTGVGDGTPVHEQYGYLQVFGTAPSNDPVTVTATFLGAPGYESGATASATTKPLQQPTFSAEPTVARVKPGLKLTLTLSTHATNFVGAPMAGVPVVFTIRDAYEQGAPGPQTEPIRWIEICTAYTDANGLATCGGSGLLGSVASLLTGGAYATWATQPWGNFTKLPVVVSG
ncbi:hypothetical protein [Nocardioides marmorisolisilvae]|uniref:Uncharacterized protein n=1 Tax=Nocardioides marmorisolisilvae TaxID=1542737 RepID=A0A3N0DZB6_9ACTN|nr:hypothetical protein [Nocardioides marmorisolisilvae]RNL80942.1 hypothetical protein EFL95_00720 [Nocardioides marmorisolisilvae]